MLNPKHLLKLQEALQMIMGPHQGYKNRTLTQLIKQGEQILAQLRAHSCYAYLLTNYLSDLQFNPSKLNVEWKNKNKAFVLLELKKISPLASDNSWWHLLQFFYSCDEKTENQVIELVIMHLRMEDQNLRGIYRQFLSYQQDWGRGGMLRVAKAISLAGAITSDLEQRGGPGQVEHIEYVAEFLQNLLSQTVTIMPNYSQHISVCIMRLVMIGHQIAGTDRNSGQSQFREKQIVILSDTICKSRNLPSKLNLLLYLCSAGINNNNLPSSSNCSQLPSVLGGLLRAKAKKTNCFIHELKILNYFLTNFEENRNQLKNYQYQILTVYQEYITQVEVHQSAYLILPSSPKESEEIGERLPPCSLSTKFHILDFCLRGELLQNIVRRSEITMVALFAYLSEPIGSQSQIQTARVVVAYIKSLIHHPRSENIPTIICCLRYLYLHIIENPNYDLLDICTALINLRLSCPSVQQLCDILLCKAAGTIATTVKGSEIWEFVNIWRDSLMQNYMDVTAVSFYPILLIMDMADDHYFDDFASQQVGSLKSPIFYEHILGLLVDESKSIQSQTTDHAGNSWCDNFQVFYKWCSVYIKYLSGNRVFAGEDLTKMSMLDAHRNSKIMDIINNATSHIFRNELYCADTAYLYVMKLIMQGPKQGLFDFVNNLMTEAFWRGLDQSQVYFYCCVLIGIVRGFNDLFPPHEIYPRFIPILHQIISAPEFSEEDLTKMKSELIIFFYHLGTQSNQDEFIIINQLSVQVTKKSGLTEE